MDNIHIILLGHRAQHGKDTVGVIMENLLKNRGIDVHSTYFAKLLKDICATKYDLDFSRMGDGDYKASKPSHLGGQSVRDILLKEGKDSRAAWGPVWAYAVWKEILFSPVPVDVGIVTDYRFPNEGVLDEFIEYSGYSGIKPTLHKVLVHRPDGPMNDDGADAELPDDSEHWDYIIHNDFEGEDWVKNLEEQSLDFLRERVIGV